MTTPTRSLRRKVTFAVFAAIGVSLLFAATGLGLLEYRAEKNRLKASLEALAQISFTQIIPAVDFNVAEAGQEALGRLEGSSLVIAATVLVPRSGGTTGPFARFVRRDRTPYFPGTAQADGFYLEGDRALLVTTFAQNGVAVAVLQIEGDLSASRREFITSLQLLGGVFILLLGIGWLLAGRLERAITRPVLALSATARRVHETGDFQLRATPETDDEIGQLAVQFNEMIAGIAERDRQLAAATAFQVAILNHAGISVISTGVDGVIRTFNRAAELMLGYTAADVVGRCTPEIFHDSGEIAVRAAELSAEMGHPVPPGFEAFVAKTRRGEVNSREWTYVRRDGSRLPVLLVVSALRQPDGTLIGFCGLATDLTQRKEAEAAVQQLNAELEDRVNQRTAELANRVIQVEQLNAEQVELLGQLRQSELRTDRATANLQEVNSSLLVANQELEAFSYSVSHDLRAPLRNITGFIELMRKRTDGKLDAESNRFLSTVIAETARMGLLIDDLLTFSRLGRAEMKLQPVRLAELIEAVKAELHPDLVGRVIEWRLSPLPLVQGDRVLLHQVVSNLLSNAVKFTRHRPAAVIEIGASSLRPGDSSVTIFVRDNGAGFNPKYLDKLFGVFQRLHSAKDFEGTGIGLANVKRIITRHGGRVWAEGAVDRGATFYFTLRTVEPSAPLSA
jgi:PAS domain S-box-containing protein